MNQLPLDPAGWWLSEKLDGCRCIFDGRRFLSRHGRRFTPPAWWLEGMPDVRLDGELYAGRGMFDSLVANIQRRDSDWQGIRFEVFDIATLRQPIESRLAMLATLRLPDHCGKVIHRACTGHRDLDDSEAAVCAAGGEGLCLRAPGSLYTPSGFLRVKRIHKDLDRSVLD